MLKSGFRGERKRSRSTTSEEKL